ncbi:hypothetical protein FSP39_012117 [Pinctada imbricata]|uniref:Uncharacterized protein n=1 Tax=Pinctada imbricata TaxID=66713 RepID=A0AA89BZA6_PINIB|nr:hypothetical protein FSP39_012117 [Pinctada imbricata]
MIHDLGNLLKNSDNETDDNDRIFIVSRNPYSRLYAAYIDRVFLPAMKSYALKVAKTNNKTRVSNMTYMESKEQRSYYLYDAYKRVSRQTVIQIQRAYYLDFILFDYDMEPP